MPLPVGIIGGVLLAIVGGIVARSLVALGIAFVVYYGVYEALELIQDQVKAHINALPQTVVSILGLLQVGKALTILFSCMFANMVINGITGGEGLKRMIFK